MIRILGIVFIATLAFGCDDDDDFGDDLGNNIDDDLDGVIDEAGEDLEDELPPSTVVEWRADIAGNGIYGSLGGTSIVTMTVGESVFSASIELLGDTPGAIRPWHVHAGTCATGGDIVGADGAYPRLVIGANGTAAAEVIVDGDLDLGTPYHINVHQSDAQFDELIACGNLVRF